MSEVPSAPPTERHAQLEALAGALRPELHRYCARLMGSVIEGEDVVQDTFARAFVALDELQEAPPLRAWLFRIAHNRALDLLRSHAIRAAEPIESAHEVADPESPDPVEALMRREAVETAVSRFGELPTVQRSVVILKDVLDQSLVVEDAWHLAKALKSALTEVGMDVAGPAATIAEAERLVTERQPDVAVVDVNLKGEMAYGLIDLLHDRGVSVIIVSGYAVLPKSTHKAAAILQKPFSVAVLLATLRRVLQ